MTIRVQLFGILAARIGQRELSCAVEAPGTVSQLLDGLSVNHPVINQMRDKLAVAVNLEYVKGDCVLNEGDEVAIIPPVSGG